MARKRALEMTYTMALKMVRKKSSRNGAKMVLKTVCRMACKMPRKIALEMGQYLKEGRNCSLENKYIQNNIRGVDKKGFCDSSSYEPL